jgi:hypothetical protein
VLSTVPTGGAEGCRGKVTTRLDTLAFEDYIEQCPRWAAEFLNLQMPGEVAMLSVWPSQTDPIFPSLPVSSSESLPLSSLSRCLPSSATSTK